MVIDPEVGIELGSNVLRSCLVVHCIFTTEWCVFGKQPEALTVKDLMLWLGLCWLLSWLLNRPLSWLLHLSLSWLLHLSLSRLPSRLLS